MVGRGKKMRRCALTAKQYPGKAQNSHMGECEAYKEERDVLEERRKVDEF